MNTRLWIVLASLIGGMCCVLCVWLFTTRADRANITQDIVIPPQELPSPNAFDDFNAATALVRDDNIFNPTRSVSYLTLPDAGQPGSLPWATKAQQDQVVRDNSAAIARLHAGLQHEFESPAPRSYKAEFPYYAKYRNMTRLLRFEGRSAALRGSWYEAASDDVDAMQIGSKCPNGGVLIGALVGYACSSIGRTDVWAAIEHLNSSEAAALANRIQQMQQRRLPFYEVVQQEKWAWEASITEVFQEKDGLTKFLQYGNAIDSATAARWNTETEKRFYEKYPKQTTIQRYDRYMDALTIKYRQPYSNVLNWPDPPTPDDPICTMIIPDLSKARFRDVSDDANTQLLMTALGLRAYEADHAGAFPESLSILAPRHLKTVPYDPFAANDVPLHYHRMGSTYILYSVGADGVDNGGKPFSNGKHPRTPMKWEDPDTKGDIVAGKNIS